MTTSIHTLMKVPESLLCSMFMNPSPKVEYDKYGRVFIDANPTVFREVLSYLQYDGNYEIPTELRGRVVQELTRWGVDCLGIKPD